MLGLLAHGLHLLLVVLGLFGVTALLLPQLWSRHSGTPTYHPPATLAEHDQRVAALRSAVRTGQLTAPPMVPPIADLEPAAFSPGHSWPGVARDGSPWRAVAVSSSVAAAFVHAAMFPHHLREGVLLGAFFVLSAAAQAVWAYLLARKVTSRLLILGIIGNLGCIALWATTRTVGLPFGLIPGPEGVGAWDVSCVVWEWAVVLTCTVGMNTDPQCWRSGLGDLGREAWTWISLSAALLAVLSLTVAHG